MVWFENALDVLLRLSAHAVPVSTVVRCSILFIVPFGRAWATQELCGLIPIVLFVIMVHVDAVEVHIVDILLVLHRFVIRFCLAAESVTSTVRIFIFLRLGCGGLR